MLASLALAAGPGFSREAVWPSQPLRLVCEEPPPCPADLLARGLATALRMHSRHPVDVAVRNSRDGMAGAGEVAKAAPDGHLLLLASDQVLTLKPHVHRTLPYAAGSLRPLVIAGACPLVVAVNPGRGFTKLADLVTISRIKPLSFVSPGVASPGRLAMAQLRLSAGARLMHTPLPEQGAAAQAIARGEVEGGVLPLHDVMHLVRSGGIQALAVTGHQRSRLLPGVPTVTEAGLPQATLESLLTVMAASATPMPLLDAMQAALVEALHQPGLRTLTTTLGIESEVLAGTAAVRRIAELGERYGRLAQATGIAVD